MKLPSLVALIALFLLAAPLVGSSSSDLLSHSKIIIKLNDKVEQIESTATPAIKRQPLLERSRNSQRSLIDGRGNIGSSNSGGGGGAAAVIAAGGGGGGGASKDAAGDQYHGADIGGHHSRDAVAWLNSQHVPPPDNN